MCLYIAGLTPRSTLAVERIRAICERYLAGRYELTVIDLYLQPEAARQAQIVVVPTLVKQSPITRAVVHRRHGGREEDSSGLEHRFLNRSLPLKAFMITTPKTNDELLEENERLRLRLEEAEAVVEAIRNGIVDAVVVHSTPGESVYTLEGADRPYRLLVEAMQQGVAVLNPEGVILYCNPCLADLFKMSVEKVTGCTVDGFVAEADHALWTDLLRNVENTSAQKEVRLRRQDGTTFPAALCRQRPAFAEILPAGHRPEPATAVRRTGRVQSGVAGLGNSLSAAVRDGQRRRPDPRHPHRENHRRQPVHERTAGVLARSFPEQGTLGDRPVQRQIGQ